MVREEVLGVGIAPAAQYQDPGRLWPLHEGAFVGAVVGEGQFAPSLVEIGRALPGSVDVQDAQGQPVGVLRRQHADGPEQRGALAEHLALGGFAAA